MEATADINEITEHPEHKKVHWSIHVIRIFLGALFVFSGILKMTDLVTFSEAVYKFQMLPDYLINLVTVLIPSAEVVCGLALILGIFKRGASLILTVLMTMFTIVIAVTLSKGIAFNCDCFGPLQLLEEMSWFSVFTNVLLITLLLISYNKNKNNYPLEIEAKPIIMFTIFVSIIGIIPLENSYFFQTLYKNKIIEINYNTAVEMINKDNAVLVDSRSSRQYLKGHHPNAISLPHGKIDKYFHNLVNILKEQPVIVYCDNHI